MNANTLAARLAGALVATLFATSCSPGGSGPSRAQAENEIAVRSLMAMIGSAKADDVAGLFHPDAIYDDYANQRQYRGMEEISGYITGGTRWATAVSMDVMSVHVSDSMAVAEWVFSGIQDHPIGSFLPVATGREVVLNGITVIEMEDGRIRRAADYVDALQLVLQLGGEVRMPGGGVLRQDPGPAPDDEELGDSDRGADPLQQPDTLPFVQEPS